MTRPSKKPQSYSAGLKKLIEVALTDKKVNLNLSVQDQDWVAIEGDRTSLQFLGNLLLEFAKDNGPDHLTLDSPGPCFKDGSDGILLYRKP